MAGGLIDAIIGVGNAGQEKIAARGKERLAREEKERYLRLLRNQDRTPDLVSDSVGQFERSRSPVADAFLESMLTGSNPAAIQGTRAGAAGQQRAAQSAFSQQYGGMDALRARQRQAAAATPWLPGQVPLAQRLDEQNVDQRATMRKEEPTSKADRVRNFNESIRTGGRR